MIGSLRCVEFDAASVHVAGLGLPVGRRLVLGSVITAGNVGEAEFRCLGLASGEIVQGGIVARSRILGTLSFFYPVTKKDA